MIRRDSAGQHGTVGRKGQGNRRIRVGKKHAFPGKPVNVRGGLAAVAVAAEVVGAAGIDADKKDIADRCF